jgi:hypothetical protein
MIDIQTAASNGGRFLFASGMDSVWFFTPNHLSKIKARVPGLRDN